MTALLTDNLPLLTGAPNGIKKLRELILELAVRGKLLPQDPSDEPASELLKRIAEEKARLLAEGKIKKQKAPSERDAKDPAFELPAGWAWARLADVVNVLNGRAYKKEELLDAGTPVLRVGNLFTSNHWYYSNLTLEEDKYCNPGDLLFAWSASFGPFIWHGERSIYHYHIWKLDFYAKDQLSKHYLYNYLLEQTQEIKAAGHGVSMIHMTKEKMEKLVVPVPPLAEQQRIVAKVDELMALCDRLEAQQADAESAHAQLMQALLGSLTQATDAEDFAQSWQRLAEHFHTLFTTEPSIDALKRATLELAVMGKLSAPQQGDTSIAEILERMAEDRNSKGPKEQETERHMRSYLATIESNRVTVRADFLCGFITKGTTPAKNDLLLDGEIPFLKVYNIVDNKIDFLYRPTFISREISHKELGRSKIYPGDIVMNIVGPPLGKVAIIPEEFPEWNMNQALSVFRVKSGILNKYIYYMLLSESVLKSVISESKGSAGQDNLSLAQCRALLIPIPSTEEQHRVVAKLDQLMALCDQLKTRLTQARQLNEQLASTLVKQAIS